MKQFILITLSLIAFCSYNALSQSGGTIKGTITTSEGKPAGFVSVGLKGKLQSAITNSKGEYAINKLRAGNYIIKVSAVSLSSQEKQVMLTANETVVIDFVLNENEQQLQEVIVRGNNNNKFVKKATENVARMPISDLENPQVYSTVSKELLQEQLVTSFDDAVKNVPGLDKLWSSTGRGGDGAAYYTLRGFSVQPTMINGIAGLTNGGLDPANIERIEVIKGPSGTLFGSSLISFGGLINIATKAPYDSLGGEISYTAGGFGLNRVAVDVNTPVKDNLFVCLNGAYHSENSYQDAGFRRSLFIAPSIVYKANDRLDFHINTEFYNSESTNPMMVFLSRTRPFIATTPNELNMDFDRSYTSNDLTIKTPSVNLFGQMNYKLADNWKSQTTVSRSIRKSDGYYQYVMFTGATDNILGRYLNYQNSTGTSTDIQQNFIGDFSIGKIRNRLVVGVDYFNVTSQNNSTPYITFDNVSSVDPKDPKYGLITRVAVDAKLAAITTQQTKNGTDANTYSAYLSNVLNVTDKLLAMLSLRVDHFDNKGSTNFNTSTTLGNHNQTSFSPKLGLVYQIVKDKIAVFSNYMNGFRNVAPGSNPSPYSNSFKPQHAEQFEGGFKIDLLDHRFSLTTSYYDILVTNMTRSESVVIDGTPTNITFQDGSQLSRGFEFDAIANPVAGLNVIIGYAYNRSKNIRTAANFEGRRPSGSGPEQMANAWLSYSILQGKAKGLGIGFGGNYVSDYYTTDNAITGVFTIPSYTVFNSSIFYNTKSYRVGLKVDNLGNKDYYKGWTTVEQQLPRRVSANLTFKF